MESTRLDNDLPRVLITSSNCAKAKEIASNLGGKYLIKQPDTEDYLLNIDNKYYTAEILLSVTEINENVSIDPSNYEALVFHYDLQTEDNFRHMTEQVIPVIAESEIEILLLVCNSIPNITVREKVIEWCASKKFELIELEHLDSKEIMDLEDDQSKYGIERIMEVLETHMWPNIDLKESRKNVPVIPSEVNEVGDQLENVRLYNSQNFSDHLEMESMLDGIINSEGTDFVELFSRLREMKETAASMPSQQRRVAAEQIVTAFWRAIGGDPSEIDDNID